MDWSQFKKNCYMLIKDQDVYVRDGSFQNRLAALMQNVLPQDQRDAFLIVEKMITHLDLFYEAERKYLPILVYKGEEVCHDILNFFADQMAMALASVGEVVEVFDAREQPLEELFVIGKKKYKAVFGVQTYLFFLKLQNDGILHDMFQAPLYNMIFDHPVTLHNYWMDAPKNLTLLTHDRNYRDFTKQFYKEKVSCELLCPGGVEWKVKQEKVFDLTFVGSYHSWYEWIDALRALHKKYPKYVRRLLCFMKQNPNMAYETCVQIVAHQFEGEIDSGELSLYVDCKECYFAIMHFYRRKVIRAILDTGIELHVYGPTWNNRDLSSYPNLIIHEELTIEESLQVYAKSKLTLNIMSWHKDGMTERIANGMLGEAVVISDETTYLKENFENGNELILYRLDRLNELQETLVHLLEDRQRSKKIAKAGYEKAKKLHCWINRALQFVELIDSKREDAI